jgi:hypothetical protein
MNWWRLLYAIAAVLDFIIDVALNLCGVQAVWMA